MLFFFALIVFAQGAFALGDVTVTSSDFSVTTGSFDNGSGVIHSVRVSYAIEWSDIDSSGWYVPDVFPGGWDFIGALHLAWAYIDSTGPGNIEPVYNDWMENESGNRWPCDFGTCYDYGGTDTINFAVIDSDTFYIFETHWRSSGTIYVPMPQGDIRLYLVADEASWDRLYVRDRPANFCGGRTAPRIDEFTNLNDYFAGNSLWQIHLLEHRDINVPTPEPEPPLSPGIEFVDWIAPGDTTGKDWLPEPGDTVGLKFALTSEIEGADHHFTFVIWDITAWQGEAMNYPAPSARLPWHTGAWFKKITPQNSDGLEFDFDFWLAHPELYDVKVIDTLTAVDTRDMFSEQGWRHLPDTLRARNLYGTRIKRSRKTIIARTRQPVTGSHTLELVARDYAAHCMVTPFVEGSGKTNFMVYTTSLGEKTGYISVPRDEDGYDQYTHNTGDYLADAWEEKVYPNSGLRKHWPFMHPDSLNSATMKWEDDDYYMRGRAFDGDDLLNFEEYRGFWVSEEESHPNDPNPHLHVRCNPTIKDVFLYFHPALNSNLLIPEFFGEIAPGYIQNLNDTIDFRVTDYTVLHGAQSSNLRARNRSDKSVSFNRHSHYLLCPPLFIPMDSIPMDSNISSAQVLSIWPWTVGEDVHNNYFGWLKPKRLVFTDQGVENSATTPRFTNRIVMNYQAWQYVFLNYDRYNDTLNPTFLEDWVEDITEGLRVNIAHEIGHGIGLIHALSTEPQDHIMSRYRGSEHDSLGIHPRLPAFSSQDSSRFSTTDR